MRKSIFLLPTLWLAVCFLNAFPVNRNFYDDYNEQISDTRSLALGKTSNLNSNQAFSLFDNPALLSHTDRMQCGINVKFENEAIKRVIHSSSYNNIEGNYNYSNRDFKNQLSVNSFSVVIPMFKTGGKHQLGLGIGYRELYDYNFELEPKAGYFKDSEFYKGGLDVLTLGLGLKVTENVSWGLNINRGKSKNKSEQLLFPEENSYLFSDANYNEEISTMFFSFGVKYTPSSKIEIGLAATMPHDINYSANIYHMGITLEKLKEEYSINLPLEYSLAVNYYTFPDFLVAFEYRNKNIKALKADCSKPDLPESIPLYKFKSNSVKDGHDFRFGIEYKLRFPIRAGVFYTAVPLIDVFYNSYSNSLESDMKPKYLEGFTLGTEFAFQKHVVIGLAYEVAQISNNNSNSSNYRGFYEYSQKLTYQKFNLNLIYKI